MPYITSIERLAKEEGLRDGLLLGIKCALECKFGAAGLALLPRMQSKSVTKLQRLIDAIPHAASIADFRKLLR